MTQSATTLVEYSRNIAPIIRDLNHQKELLADFKESNEEYLEFVREVKGLQETMKGMLEENDDSKEILEKIKDLDNDLKEAVKAAARGTDYKPAELKVFFVARSKDEGVVKVVTKGELFSQLDDLLA